MLTVFRHRLQHLVCQMLRVTLHRDKVHGEEAAHITPPHKSFCNIHNILQDLRRNVHNPVCPVSYGNHLIPVLCN